MNETNRIRHVQCRQHAILSYRFLSIVSFELKKKFIEKKDLKKTIYRIRPSDRNRVVSIFLSFSHQRVVSKHKKTKL